jgi:Flp pilus assembly protein TadB
MPRDDEWDRTWRSLPNEQRRRIARAVARGEAVSDPRDAPLALELIDKRERQLQVGRSRWFARFLTNRHVVILVCFAVVGVAVTRDAFVIGIALLAALNLVAVQAFLRRTERKMAQARRNNEQLAQL